jgi:hypothetical protein
MCRDFNVHITQDKENFNLYCITESSTTLGNVCFDLKFARNIWSESMPYICYLSYQQPVLNRLYNMRCLQHNINVHSFNTYHTRRGQKTYSRQNLQPWWWHSPPQCFFFFGAGVLCWCYQYGGLPNYSWNKQRVVSSETKLVSIIKVCLIITQEFIFFFMYNKIFIYVLNPSIMSL